MDYNDAHALAIAYWGSNIAGLIFLAIALKWIRAARAMFAVLFGYASWVSYNLSHSDPGAYLSYAERSMDIYANLIHGWFNAHITSFVSLIAAGQLLIAIGCC